MFKDITLGQYYPTDSVIHRLDPRTKINFTFAYIILLFVVNNPVGYLIAIGILALVIALSKIPFVYVVRGLKPLIFIVVLTFVLNMFMTPGQVLWQWKFLHISRQGLKLSIFMSLRLILLVTGTSIMTLATSPMDLTDGMEADMSVIPGIKRFAHDLAMMMSIALRFIPTLMEETDKIIKAQKARGADFETGNLIERAKALIPILVPLFVSAFRRADELATAMEARCYRGGAGRTRMYVLAYEKRDTVAYLVLAATAAAMILSRFIQYPWPFPFN
ncbi:energy-coupling factor transporter transmembrane component T family protein [Pseudoramibacter sp.]|jgi:energy-coupling factor transport system permease protein|uniref:energy-coupling factor transporter transmembrane component T family protein n=1 Tax=Pseudoramibacter sp. TaxID=2034862 RepID=UPI0025DCA4E0|nr:energy-coupling factor transporter transmembrane component T [Pseudoramibacter sp.]MCH4072434.1 energy-coupling factor transporter transmembrane protein EcfT [Pseudoramibacter sp.]MCH4106205.1 energy-coupling factor transporter transmembrane protein EcfT [Pseudoramibacter sp.]